MMQAITTITLTRMNHHPDMVIIITTNITPALFHRITMQGIITETRTQMSHHQGMAITITINIIQDLYPEIMMQGITTIINVKMMIRDTDTGNAINQMTPIILNPNKMNLMLMNSILTNTSKLLLTFSIILILASCSLTNTKRSELEKKILEEKGPNIVSVEDTIKANAKEAFDAQLYAKAAGYYKQLLSREGNTTNPEFYLALADSLRLAKQFPDAHKAYDALLDIDADSMAGKQGKGFVFLEEGNFESAFKLFEDILEHDKANWRTINAVGVALALTDRKDEAMKYYSSALQLSDGNPIIRNNIGLLLALQGEFGRAISSLEHLSQTLPPNTPTRTQVDLNLSLVYGLAGRLDDAKAIAAPHLSEAALYNNLGLFARFSNDPALARTYLSKALSSSPTHYKKAWDNLHQLQ